MPEYKIPVFSRKEQEKIKPNIEDLIHEYIDGDAGKPILDFVTFLRANNMPPKWSQLNGWTARYKGTGICSVELRISENREMISWKIIPHLDQMSEYEELVVSEGLQEIIWDHIFFCVHDPKSPYSGKGCSPNKGCAGGINITILGKEIKGRCRHRPMPHINNPGETEIEDIKRLLKFEKQSRAETL